jgi:hypothetical protein
MWMQRVCGDLQRARQARTDHPCPSPPGHRTTVVRAVCFLWPKQECGRPYDRAEFTAGVRAAVGRSFDVRADVRKRRHRSDRSVRRPAR